MQEALEAGIGVEEIVSGIELELHDGMAWLGVRLLQEHDALIVRAYARIGDPQGESPVEWRPFLVSCQASDSRFDLIQDGDSRRFRTRIRLRDRQN